MEAVSMKTEPSWEEAPVPVVLVKEESVDEEIDEGVKEKLSWPESSVSEAAALAGLYADHVIKDEIVLGPERPHRPTVGLVARGRALVDAGGGLAVDAQLARDCFVRLERLPSDAAAEACESTRETSKPLPPRAVGDHTAPTPPTPHTHSRTNGYVCDTCGKSFQHRYHIIRHVQSHPRMCESSPKKSPAKNRDSKKEYACEKCQRKFTQKANLKIHERVHTGERPYSCEICFKRFTQSGSLNLHYRIHAGDKPFSCEICSKEFTAKCDRDRNRTRHSGEKPYSCQLCKGKFSDSSSLRRHNKRIHACRPYICNVCKKAFTQAGDLQKHTRTHTDERPCKVRNKAFTSASYLKSHERVHTGLKPYSCVIC